MNVHSHRRPNWRRFGALMIVSLVVASGVWRVGIVRASQRNANTASALYQQAQHEEVALGHPKEAIALYERVLAAKPDRALAAQALIHMAECHQKLGDAEAGKIYERVVKEFGDQKSAADEARTRLAASPRPLVSSAGMTNREVWTRDTAIQTLAVSADGRYLAYAVNSPNADMFLHDFVTSDDRQLTRNPDPSARPVVAAFSRDGRRLIYGWRSDNGSEPRTIDLQEPGIPRPVLLPSAELYAKLGNKFYFFPADWSPDGVSVAVNTSLGLGLLNPKDGSLRVIRSDAHDGHFSPDGKFLAYEIHPVPKGQIDDIAIVSVNGGAEIPVVVDPAQDTLLGWSPDGKHLIFTSDRAGKFGLYALQFINGKPEGAPVRLKDEVPTTGIRMTVSGQLYYEVRDQRRIYGDIKIASYDFAAERFAGPAIGVKDFVGHNAAADWSPDGKYLVNISDRGDRDGQILVIHSVETGEFVRELRSGLTLNQGTWPWPRWAPDSKSIAVPGTDPKGRHGIYQVDAQTGEAFPLVLSQAGETLRGPAFSPDGNKFLYTRLLSTTPTNPQRTTVLMERDLRSNAEKEIMRGNLSMILFSPDGQYYTIVRADTDASVALLVPANGGEPKELMRLNLKSPEGLWIQMWAPDSRSVFIGKLPEPEETFWRVSIDGGDRHTVRVDQNMGLSVRVHPDGHRLAYSVQSVRTQTEVWVLENFLSALKTGK